MNQILLNKNGVNKNIVAHIASDNEMREAGFTDHNKDVWYYCSLLTRPLKRGKSQISFNVLIPKDGAEINIEVLDEAFCQPYDYQYMLSINKHFKPAIRVRDFVEGEMEKLQKKGILSGHVTGDYI